MQPNTTVLTPAEYMTAQVEAVKDHLLRLEYRNTGTYPEPVRGQKVFRTYTRFMRRSDGAQIVLYQAYDEAGLAHYEVYKEVSRSNEIVEYRNAIT